MVTLKSTFKKTHLCHRSKKGTESAVLTCSVWLSAAVSEHLLWAVCAGQQSSSDVPGGSGSCEDTGGRVERWSWAEVLDAVKGLVYLSSAPRSGTCSLATVPVCPRYMGLRYDKELQLIICRDKPRCPRSSEGRSRYCAGGCFSVSWVVLR